MTPIRMTAMASKNMRLRIMVSSNYVCLSLKGAGTQRLLHIAAAMFLRYGLSFVILVHTYDCFYSGLCLSIIPECFGSLT